jgi:hypothetical protein
MQNVTETWNLNTIQNTKLFIYPLPKYKYDETVAKVLWPIDNCFETVTRHQQKKSLRIIENSFYNIMDL